MKISVVIPTYNREPQIFSRAFNSVLNQTLSPKEIVVVDSGDVKEYKRQMTFAKGQRSENMVLEKVGETSGLVGSSPMTVIAAIAVVVILLIGLLVLLRRKNKTEE